ncbi:hypothetical protein EDC01DRAFT_621296 [Geopyxis carbonaria]|nr:hypothetical protein EDC01DRAFT_621296 [Geopyxis carbonaria]
MPPSSVNNSAATSSSPSSQSSRSLLHRLRTKTSALSFRSSRRSLTDFHIQLNDPHRVYSPTDIVPGSVCVTVERPLQITHITVALVGRVDVYSNTREASGRRRNKDDWDDAWPNNDGYNDSSAPYGRVNLCRDEIVLCGEGRLEPGVYKFGFELEFCKLPGIGEASLPTSLDFEKGSISYSIQSTLTRPTAVASTTSCSTKISMMETIDIGHLPVPKPQLIELEPISRLHSKHKHAQQQQPPPPLPLAELRPVSPSTTASSPASSELNLADNFSDKKKSTKPPITATVEILKAGALRGEFIRVKISIKHTKKIKSMNGVILTLMRQTRFDPIGDIDINSLSKIKPSHIPPISTFRKDLAQTICPLIIDPNTLTAVIRANLRVPEDVFPTIRNVPGGSVEFRYFVEVVMDLGGKLNGREDIFSAVVPGFQGIDTSEFSKAGGINGGMSVEGGVMVETERIRRREKSVVACRFEVVIGSVDTVGRKGRMAKQPEPVPAPVPALITPAATPPQPQHAPEYDPRWNLPSDTAAEQKARIRLAEETLLPSEPPSAGPSAVAGPSAPPPPPEDPDPGTGEDKAERERQRLQALESEPPIEMSVLPRPSAPRLDDLPEYSR